MSWKKIRLGDICTKIGSGATPKGGSAVYVSGGIALIRSQNVYNLQFSYDGLAYIHDDAAKKLDGVTIHPEDVLINITGDSVARTCMAPKSVLPARVNQHVCIIRTNKLILNPQFLNYYLASPYMQSYMLGLAVGKGASRNAMTKDMISDFEIPCPSIEVQNYIADILSAYDDLIENNQKQIKLLEEAAQRLYKEWFVDLHFPGWENATIVDGVPEGWHENVLDEIAYQSGKTENKNNRSQYRYYLPIDCLPQKSLTYLQYNDVDLAESSLIGFGKDDILFGAMRPYFHKVVVARDCGLTRSTCFVINSKKEYMWAYLVMLLFSENTIQYATQISVGTTMPYVRWKDFIQMRVLVPEKSVLMAFQKFVSPIIAQLSVLAEKVLLLQEARDRLLPKLMSGELEV